MTDPYPACVALSKHTTWQTVAGIALHQFATFPNIAHEVLSVLVCLHECCRACQQVLIDKQQDQMHF